MFNLLIYKKIYHNNLELKEIYTMRSKQLRNVYRFMYHYIWKLRINLIISQYFPVNTSISREIPVFPAVLGNMSISLFFANPAWYLKSFHSERYNEL